MTTRTVSELAELCSATLEGDGDRRIVGPASLAEASAEEIAFFANARYAADLERTRAGAVLVARELETERSDLTLLRCDHPNRAFTRVVEVFRPKEEVVPRGVHPSAVVEGGAEVAPDARVAALVHVGAGAVLEAGVVLHAGVVVGAGAHVGEGSELHAGVVLYPRVRIGKRCIVHGGTVLGSDGFGFEPVDGGWEKIPQCGTVELGDDVELGANCTVDRGRFGPTRILDGTKIDNLVHVGHNVSAGPHACLVAQVGVSGSTRIGAGVVLAGQVGVSGHVEIGDGTQVGGQSSVMKSLPSGGQFLGSPARPLREQLRAQAAVTRLPDLVRRVAELERRVAELGGEEGGGGR